MKIKRRYLTLVEMLIVIGLLTLIAGVVGIKVNKILHEQRFRSEVSQIVDQLRLAQDLMLIFDSNVHLKFNHTDEGLEYGITFDNPLPNNWSHELQRPHKKLKYIRQINFPDERFPENRLKNDGVDIQFLSGGSVMSRGLLELVSADDDRKDDDSVLKRYIWLSGTPQPIYSEQNPLVKATDIDLGIDTRLTQITRDEIMAKQEVKDKEAEVEEQKEREEETKLEKASAQKEKRS